MQTVVVSHVRIEDFKRIRLAEYDVPECGLFLIGGDNRQGKTSNLDAIAAALGGESFVPPDAVRRGAKKGSEEITLSNGWTVKRTHTVAGGGTLTLKGITVGGGTQTALDKCVSRFALDISQWLNAKGPAQLKMLLKIVGVDFTEIDRKRAGLYEKRTSVGQQADRAKGHFESLPWHEGAGPVQSAAALNGVLTEIQGEAQAAAQHDRRVADLQAAHARAEQACEQAQAEVFALEKKLAAAKATLTARQAVVTSAAGQANAASDTPRPAVRDAAPILEQIKQLDATNAMARENVAKTQAETNWKTLAGEYTELTHQIEAIDAEKLDTLAAAEWPLKAISVAGDSVTYKGVPWENVAHSDRLIATTAICQRMLPACGFVLIDGLEAMDDATLKAYDAWLVSRKLQAIGTRVSDGPECDLIFKDGEVAGVPQESEVEP